MKLGSGVHMRIKGEINLREDSRARLEGSYGPHINKSGGKKAYKGSGHQF